MTRIQPSPSQIRRARKQVLERMPARVRVTRKDGSSTYAANGLDLTVGKKLVYEGRARVELEVTGQRERGDEQVYDYTGSVVLPYEVNGRLVRPMVEDLVEVLEHPDALYTGATAVMTSIAAAGHMAVFRRCSVQGSAPNDTWGDDTPRPVREQR